jgi:hypothetical protein
VSKASNSDDTDARGRSNLGHVQGIKHCRSSTHQGTYIFVIYRLGNLEEEALAPHGVGTKRSLVGVGSCVYLSRLAHCLPTREALLVVTTAVVLISLAHAVEQVRVRTICLVAEGHVGSLVVNVGATHTGVSDSDEDIVAFEVLSLGLGLLDAGILGAFVNVNLIVILGEFRGEKSMWIFTGGQDG